MPTKAKKKPIRKKVVKISKPPIQSLPPGIKGARIEDLLGIGKDLWGSDEELDRFLEGIRKRRQH